MTRVLALAAAAVAVVFSTAAAPAEEAYYYVHLEDLKVTEGQMAPDLPGFDRADWRWRRTLPPYVALEGQGEAYVERETPPGIVVRTPEAREVRGLLVMPRGDETDPVRVRFVIPSDGARREFAAVFAAAKAEHFETLLSHDLPGGAWFRHQTRLAQDTAGKAAHKLPADAVPQRPERAGQLVDTFALFTGGRALSENLQLDRAIRATDEGPASVDIQSIPGISIREIEWEPLVKDLKPQFDPLAKLIPADQHAAFFPSVDRALEVADLVREQGGFILHLAEPRAENARTFERYEAQLGLPLDQLARLLGPAVVQSVAITGSDPYFPTGTDLAVLLETTQPAILEKLLAMRVQATVAGHDGVEPVDGDVDGVAYRGFRSPDRAVSSYVARLPGAVVVTNSLYQLRRLASAQQGAEPTLASLPEYTFFRNRYARADHEEAGFVFLSDATIRRWCGPRWRIGTSRRARQAAVLAEVQATWADDLMKGVERQRPVVAKPPLAAEWSFTLASGGVLSEEVGTLGFLTPIAEMPLDRVTKAEGMAYTQWRDRYQWNWRWAFDPIGLRLTVDEGRLGADLTVMPLIFGSEYNQFVGISRGAKIPPGAGDPHDALAHAVLAINRESSLFRSASSFVEGMTQGVALGWVGDTVAVYADDDPFWQEVSKLEPGQRQSALEKNASRLPIGAHIDVSSGLKLTAFLTTLRAFSAQSAPGMVVWENLTWGDHTYVKISPSPEARNQADELAGAALYYAPSPDSLLISLNEDVLKRAIDRRAAKKAPNDLVNFADPLPAAKPWLGENLALQVDRKLVETLVRFGNDEYQRLMQSRSWGNLPILNEWKRLYPNEDPVAVHQRLWQTRLVCPGGGQYVWNEQWQTMESTIYGHPAQPKTGTALPPLLARYAAANFGLTFEEQGLRAQVMLEEHRQKEE